VARTDIDKIYWIGRAAGPGNLLKLCIPAETLDSLTIQNSSSFNPISIEKTHETANCLQISTFYFQQIIGEEDNVKIIVAPVVRNELKYVAIETDSISRGIHPKKIRGFGIEALNLDGLIPRPNAVHIRVANQRLRTILRSEISSSRGRNGNSSESKQD